MIWVTLRPVGFVIDPQDSHLVDKTHTERTGVTGENAGTRLHKDYRKQAANLPLLWQSTTDRGPRPLVGERT